MKHKYWRSLIKTFSLAVAGSFLLVSTVFASPYGSGKYGACAYQIGCKASSSSTPASVTPTTETTTPIVLNDYNDYFNDGVKLDVHVGDVICFDVENNGVAERHCITIKAIGENYVDVMIDSATTDVRFFIGDIKQFDVTDDQQNDIEITLNSITGANANFTFKQLGKELRPTTPAPTTTPSKAHAFPWTLVISLFVLALGLLWFIILWLRRRRKGQDYNPPTVTPSGPTPPNVGRF